MEEPANRFCIEAGLFLEHDAPNLFDIVWAQHMVYADDLRRGHLKRNRRDDIVCLLHHLRGQLIGRKDTDDLNTPAKMLFELCLHEDRDAASRRADDIDILRVFILRHAVSAHRGAEMQRNVADLVLVKLDMVNLAHHLCRIDGNLKGKRIVLLDRSEQLIADIYAEVHAGNRDAQVEHEPILEIFVRCKVKTELLIYGNEHSFNKLFHMGIVDGAPDIQQLLARQETPGDVEHLAVWDIDAG